MKNIKLNYVAMIFVVTAASSTIMPMNLRKTLNHGVGSASSAFNNASNAVVSGATDLGNSAVNSAASAADSALNAGQQNIVNPIDRQVVRPAENLAQSVAEHGRDAINTAGDVFDKTGQIIKALPSIMRSLSDIMKELQDMINAGMASAKATTVAINPIAQEMSVSIGKLQETISHLM